MFDQNNRFIIENFHKKNAFSSFLPGVAGEKGIPIWCFYVNRGQAVCSFGTGDKEHPIMEFSPAHVAYQEVAAKGFRTFVKRNGEYLEPFRPTDSENASMHIGMNELLLEESFPEQGLRFKVRYFILPEDRVGALMRELIIENIGEKTVDLEVLDGMPAMLTYGTSNWDMKSMAQTHKAWMQVEDVQTRMPYYRLRASSADTAEVKEIQEGHFALGFSKDGELLPVIADPTVVFAYNLALSEATGFKERPLGELLSIPQITSNHVATAFFAAEKTLAPGESLVLHEAYGLAASKEILRETAKRLTAPGVFDAKHRRAVELTDGLTDGIATRTADPVFDAYCRQTYLDNLLRGGYPITIGGKVFYVYSRKHGDIERDYNFFQMLPEYYSQGNANFRDINQNRRSDPLFAPEVGDHNIKLFMDLIQLDGYNPLVIERMTFTLDPEKLDEIAALAGNDAKLRALLEKPFTPGALATLLEQIDCKAEPAEILSKAMEYAVSNSNVTFGEGYWTDHWTYNLDLIESYLAVFPEREEALLFDDETYKYYEPHAAVNPRAQRYTLTPKGVRQYGGVTERETERDWVGTKYGKGEEYHTNLISKLIVLAMNKVAALDPMGMGVEMEAGKPGWYDALNGLPGLLGSSIAESCETIRLIDYTETALRRYGREVRLPRECAEYLEAINRNIEQLRNGNATRFAYWDSVGVLKEAYRERILSGVDGEEVTLSAEDAVKTLASWKQLLLDGVERARAYCDGFPPCYFMYEVTDYEQKDGAIRVKAVKESPLPLFLEGAVRYMKMPGAALSPAELHARVKESPLFDKDLRMYKVNSSLAESSFELGRCRAFTPGWLENESIWLHMEYKYLLGLLRAGLYDEFFTAFHDAGVPFLDPEHYGRSPLENSSFIASSANPNPAFRGKGFVARLSGSTAEFVQMWQIMMFGEQPFTVENGTLIFRPQPAIPAYLMDESGVDCTLLGRTAVHYKAAGELIPGVSAIREIIVHWADGASETFGGGQVSGKSAERIRSREAASIEIAF